MIDGDFLGSLERAWALGLTMDSDMYQGTAHLTMLRESNDEWRINLGRS
jgi:hypothetical protein